MKTITMDFDLYLQEKNNMHDFGLVSGRRLTFELITNFLKSGKSFSKWYWSQSFDEEPRKDWKALLAALGRENEWEEAQSPNNEQ